ncbi:MAG: exodeoxyribonuclease VII large subunit [Acidimicrobiales bacterium]
MARKRSVEALQFDFVEVEEDQPDDAPEPVSGHGRDGVETVAEPAEKVTVVVARRALPPRPGRLPGLDQTSQGLQLAREALASPSTSRAMAEISYDGVSSSAPPDASLAGSEPDMSLSIAEFYERLGQALRREFPEEIWVTGEIRKVTVARTGHRYLEMADHCPGSEDRGGAGTGPVSNAPLGNGGRPAAALEVACWSRAWPAIAAELKEVGVELTAGLVLRVRGRVSVWEGGAKVRFSMSALDVEALVGGIAAARRKLLLALESEGILDANRRLPVPLVPLQVGLVTSAGGEAYRDFTGQLQRSGLAFETRFEPVLVQGAGAPREIAEAVERLRAGNPDVIVIVRGGGAKGDLAAFDHEVVARAITSSRCPIWTGIGHTGDRSVADEVAQRALVTPTACGEAVVDAVVSYLDGVRARSARIGEAVSNAVAGCEHRVIAARSDLSRAARHEISRAESSAELARNRAQRGAVLAIERCSASLSRRAGRLSSSGAHRLLASEERLGQQRAMLDAFDPRRQLERGWSLTRREGGGIVRSVADVMAGQHLVTIVADGTVPSVAGEPVADASMRTGTDVGASTEE